MLACHNHTPHIGSHYAVKGVLFHVQHSAGTANANIVEQNINPAEQPRRGVGDALAVRL